MAELLKQWVQDAGVEATDLEQDFANGYLFGKLLYQFDLQPDFPTFVDKGKPDAFIKNYTKLQPTLTKLGVQMDTRTAQSLINKEPGLAARVLYSIKQALDTMSKDSQVIEHTGRTLQQLGLRSSPTRGLLDSQNFKSQQAAYQTGNLKFFEDVMRKKSQSPNAMMESLHLKRFADEGSRLATAAAEAAAAEKAMKESKRAAFRDSERTKLTAARNDKANRLDRDEAVHAAIIKHQDDLERQELRVEMALSELGRHKQQTQVATAAADAASGIDAFEMTLKRLGAEGGSDDVSEGPIQGESPMGTLSRIRTFAPTAAKLAESGGEYLSTVKARRHEEVAGRKEREARRKKLLVEQQAARTAAESRVEADSLLEVLVRRSAEEQKLGQRLFQLRQEKAAMEADRRLKEQQYAARREKDWEDTLRREAELHRSMKAQHDTATQQELMTWREQQQARAAAKAAKHTAFANQVAWQLVQLAERVIEYRAATAGQQVPRRDWRAWLALFTAGDPSLGSPVISQAPVSKEAEETRRIMNTAELQDYLAGQGEWTPPPDAVSSRPSTASSGTAAARRSSTDSKLGAVQQSLTLGRVVAELAALAQKLQGHPAAALPAAEQGSKGDPEALATTAAAAAAQQADTTAQTIQSIPLKIAVAGGPFAGKSTVARALSDKFGLKLIVPEQLVTDATAAAQAWEQQQQQQEQQQQSAQQQEGMEQQPQELVAPAAAGLEPSQQVLLGQEILQQLQQGQPVSDELLVRLLLLAMLDAKDYTAAPPEPIVVDPKAAKAGKAGGKSDAAAGTAAKGGATPPGTADAAAAPAIPLPAHLAAGAPGRGFVIDGFPATVEQAMLLEKALTGLDTAAEQALVDQASVVAPPPLDALPQLPRPLRSGLDAVIVLGCSDESIAVKRALGRRLDPTTGRIYHLDFDPPPAGNPGLSERLVMVSGADNDTLQVPQRLASYATSAAPLSEWLSRFSTLRRPLDGSASLTEVLAGASDIVSGILVAKGAAHAAQTAAEAAQRARDSAEKARDFAKAAQGHAEGAARELLAAKRAEIQAAALLNGGKNPDPASTEVLKAQAAAKCADQLKVCRTAAADASHHAERADSSSQQASAAVQRCKLAVGDAAVSAEAEAAANKAAADAEAAASAAADAAKKAEAAKHLAEAYVAEAEKWFAATDVPADAAVPSAQQLCAAAGDKAADSSDVAPPAAPAAQVGSYGNIRPLPGPADLPAALVPALHDEWRLLEHMYIDGMGRGFSGLREARSIALNHVAKNCSWFGAFLKRPDNKQQMLQSFVERFNAVEVDMRKAKETQGELLLRAEELRDALWAICDAKHEEAQAARLKLANDGSAAQHVALLGQHLTSLVQVELDRFLATCQFLYSYCFYSQGIYHPPGADKPLCPLPTSLAAAPADTGKPEAAAKGAPPVPAYFVSLQQKLPQLAAALKAAGTAAAATQTNALGLVDEASRRSAAAAANAAATANAAAAAAAVAAGAPAGGHRASTASSKGGTAGSAATAGGKGGGTAADKNSKLAANSEEAAVAAAAAAAAVAALPDPAALAAVQSLLQSVLAQEVQLLHQRLAVLGSKAAVIVDEVVQLQATANSQLAEWQQRRYVAECGAVAALEKVVKAAAAAGQPLPYDLRLEDEFFIVDESRPLVPPPSTAPAPRPPSPALPPGVLSVQQIQQLATALQQAAPGGFLAMGDATDLMLKMASQGVLPSAWQDIDASHMTAALAGLDPTYSGYLDWRELLLSLAAASIPAIHTATSAQVAAQAGQLAAVDSDQDGYLTLPEFEGVTWWFEPKPEAVQAAQEAVGGGTAVGTEPGVNTAADGAQGQDAQLDKRDESVQWAEDVLRKAKRCSAVKALLWDLFKQTLNIPVKKQAAAAPPPPAAAAAAQLPPPPSSPKAGAKGGHNTKASSAASSQRTSQSEAGGAGTTVAAASSDSSADSTGTPTEVCCSNALLLYLCPDRDLYQGIIKAVTSVTGSGAANAVVDAAAVLQMCYPLLTPEQAAPIQRAPLTAAQIQAAVTAAAAAADSAAGTAGPAHTASGHSSSGQAGNAAGGTAAQQVTGQPAIKASQLMYSGACERIVTLMLQRYQWKDVYIAAKM